MRIEISFAFALALSGCASLDSYQEARVLDKGDWKVSVPATFALNSSNSDADRGYKLVVPQVEVRSGLGHGIDVGLKTNWLIFPSISVDAKLQLAGLERNSTQQLAVGLKLAHSTGPDRQASGDGWQYDDYDATDAVSTLFWSWTPRPWLGTTVAPEFCYRFSREGAFYSNGPFLGTNLDLRLGSRYGVLFEYGIHHQLEQDADPWNCGIALFLRFGE